MAGSTVPIAGSSILCRPLTVIGEEVRRFVERPTTARLPLSLAGPIVLSLLASSAEFIFIDT